MKMSFICMRMKNHFLVNGFTLDLTYGLSHLKIAHDLILGPDCNTPDLSRFDVRHLISDVCQMSELSCQKSDVTCLMSDVWSQISDIRHHTSHIRRLTSTIYHTSDVCPLSWNVWHQMSGICQTFHVRCLMCDMCDVWNQMSDSTRLKSDVWCPTSDVRCLISNVWCHMSNSGHFRNG